MNTTNPFPNIYLRTSVTVNLSADQWALRTSDYDRGVVDKVANLLNKRITNTYNKGEGIDNLRLSYRGLIKDLNLYVTDQTDSVFESMIPTLYRQ